MGHITETYASQDGAPDAQGEGRVYLVDDDPDIRFSLSLLLGQAGYDVVTFPDPAAFLAGRAAMTNAVILLDMRMPFMSGLDLRGEMLKRGFRLPVIFMSGECEAQEIVDAMKGAPIEFLIKPFVREDLLRSVEAGMAQARREADEEPRIARFMEGLAQLSPREHEVMLLMLDGFQNRQIGERLGIKADTIKKYRAAICEKFGVEETMQLIEFARNIPEGRLHGA